MKVVKKKLIDGLNTDKITRFFGFLMAIFLGLDVILYWQGYIGEAGLALVGIIVLVAGVSFTFGTRVAQRDGFLDGYVQAKENRDRQKK